MLEKGFSINFLTKTRIDKNVDNEDLIELSPGLFLPIETVFIGKNSSGKTTVLSLLHSLIAFFHHGRLKTDVIGEQNELSVELIFHENHNLYRYCGSFRRPIALGAEYALIGDESLQKTVFKPSHKKDLSNVFFPKENLLREKDTNDTSRIRKFVATDASILTDAISDKESNITEMIRAVNRLFGDGAFDKIVHLFDDSIAHIRPAKEETGLDGFLFQRIGQATLLVDGDYLKRILSAGTYRGIRLFCAALIAFRQGGTILIDEIEKSFNMNFVQNLILLFNDRDINKAGATLVYTTHYAEILDSNGRTDNVNVLHRKGCAISIRNLSEDYQIEPWRSKSSYFNQNAFDNLLNYENLMELRRILF